LVRRLDEKLDDDDEKDGEEDDNDGLDLGLIRLLGLTVLKIEDDEDGLDLGFISLAGALSSSAFAVVRATQYFCDKNAVVRATQYFCDKKLEIDDGLEFLDDGLLYLSLVGLLAPAVLGISRTAAWGSGPRPHQPTIGASFCDEKIGARGRR
jgi:hypothetical protein